MLLFPSPRFRKRSGNATRKPPAPLPPVGPLLITAATAVAGADEITAVVTFDTTVQDPLASVGTAVAQKWTARYEDNLFEGDEIQVTAYNQLTIHMILLQSEAGADELNYAAGPSDISDSLGRQLAAFSAWPL